MTTVSRVVLPTGQKVVIAFHFASNSYSLMYFTNLMYFTCISWSNREWTTYFSIYKYKFMYFMKLCYNIKCISYESWDKDFNHTRIID